MESRPLELRDVPVPEPAPGEVLVKVRACGVCRTDLHVVEGELPDPKLPLVPGHQIVGTVERVGEGVEAPAVGERVGVPWLGGTDGTCRTAAAATRTSASTPTFTGYQRDGGYAEYATARADFVLPLPEGYPDLQAAPLLCAGLIGYRALRLTEIEELDGPPRLGLYGFGASAHIVVQVARHLGHEVYVCTRGERAQQFARELGARWAGGSDEPPPVELDAAIIFAPAGPLVPAALRAVRRGGTVVCAGIHMSPIPELPYELLWGERVLRSVANLTRTDGHEFMELAPRFRIQTEVQEFPLEEANEALEQMKSGELRGHGGARAVSVHRPVGAAVVDRSRRPERMRGGLAVAVRAPASCPKGGRAGGRLGGPAAGRLQAALRVPPRRDLLAFRGEPAEAQARHVQVCDHGAGHIGGARSHPGAEAAQRHDRASRPRRSRRRLQATRRQEGCSATSGPCAAPATRRRLRLTIGGGLAVTYRRR